MSKIRQCLALYSSMISGGEQHSDVSRQAFDDAVDELDRLRAENKELRAEVSNVKQSLMDAQVHACDALMQRGKEYARAESAEAKLKVAVDCLEKINGLAYSNACSAQIYHDLSAKALAKIGGDDE